MFPTKEGDPNTDPNILCAILTMGNPTKESKILGNPHVLRLRIGGFLELLELLGGGRE